MSATAGIQLINAFKDPILKLGKEIKEDLLQLFSSGLSDYIDNYFDKFSKTKTFIYRDERVNFYDVYYPVTIKNRVNKITEIKDLKNLFTKRRFVTIIGSAGSGKSMLMKHIFLSTINQYYSIPIVIELRNLNDYAGTLTEYITKIITKNKLYVSEGITERILGEGNFIFLLDGYDEIFSAHKQKITNDLEEFVDLYNKNTFVVTSRPGANAESLQRFDNFYVKPLTKKQINEFIHLQFKNHENKESIGKIITVIEKPENSDYNEYLTNPLLLSMFIFTFNNYPELPKNKSKFYWNVFDTLCTKHDAFTKKGFWLHERKSKLLNEDFENLLKWFSYISIFKGKYTFDLEFLKGQIQEIKAKLNISAGIDDLLYDLTVSISIIILDGTEYMFPHKSLQEYFTALLIKGLNEEQKKVIYENKFNTFSTYTTGGNLNLFKLCYELDKVAFLKYYILPKTKFFIEQIDKSDELSIAKSYLEAFGVKLDFTEESKGNFTLFGIEVNSLAHDSFLAFLYDGNLLSDWDALGSKEAVECIRGMLERSKIPNRVDAFALKPFDIAAQWNPAVISYIQHANLLSNFNKLHLDICSKYELLEEELTNYSINTADLLNI